MADTTRPSDVANWWMSNVSGKTPSPSDDELARQKRDALRQLELKQHYDYNTEHSFPKELPPSNPDDVMPPPSDVDAASYQLANPQRPQDAMAGYPAIPQQGARQFPLIKQSVQPITRDDIRQHLAGQQEATPQLMKQMGYEPDEDDDNNKSGSAEGSYSGS